MESTPHADEEDREKNDISCRTGSHCRTRLYENKAQTRSIASRRYTAEVTSDGDLAIEGDSQMYVNQKLVRFLNCPIDFSEYTGI